MNEGDLPLQVKLNDVSSLRRPLPSSTWTETTRWRLFLSLGVTSLWKRFLVKFWEAVGVSG